MFNISLLKEVFYQAKIPQLIGSPDFSKLQYNPAFYDYIGYSIEDGLIPVQAYSHPDDMEEDAKLFDEILSGQRDQYQLEKRYIHKSGKILTGILTVSIIREKSTGEEFVLAQVFDITEKKEIESKLRKSEKLAVVGQTAAAVAHEIRNPLTAIKGFMQLFTAEEEMNPAFLKIIMDELNRVEVIISEFLTMAKPHSEKMVIVQVKPLVQQVIQLLQSQALMKNKELHFHSIDELTPEVQGDPNSLKQVFLNIIQNSLDALSDKGRIDVTVSSDESGVSVHVADNGCGIPEERLSKLGEPFYSTKEKGTGLGLMTCFRIIENHNGRIHIDSIVGEGTNVSIWLPINK